jgi:dihydrolipoamide dehydrogenase
MVDGREVSTRNIIIATGSGTMLAQDVPGGNLPAVITSDHVLDADLTMQALPQIPESIIIVGGGIVGMEHAAIFNAYGVKTTVVVSSPRVLRLVDEEIARRYTMIAKNQGIEIITGSDVVNMTEGKGGKGLNVTIKNTESGAEEVREVSNVLWAKGRYPYTHNLGLENIGLQTHRGYIHVDERMMTEVDGVYAIGDVVPGYMLAHVASYEGEVALDNITGHYRAADYGAVPDVIFTIPEIASVGLTEQQAKDRGFPVKVTKFPFAALGRAQAIGEPDGLVKMVCDPGSGVILGMQILGAHASDVIAECTLAVQQGVTAEELGHTIHAHPTMPEAVQETAFAQFLGTPVHANR